jgi:hypothetical protein
VLELQQKRIDRAYSIFKPARESQVYFIDRVFESFALMQMKVTNYSFHQ